MGIVDNMADLIPYKSCIQKNENQACLGQTKHHLSEFATVFQHKSDFISLSKSKAEKSVGQFIGTRIEFPISHRPIVIDDGDLIAAVFPMSSDGVSQIMLIHLFRPSA